MNTVVDLLQLRMPRINYVCPPVCEVIFSATGTPIIVVNPRVISNAPVVQLINGELVWTSAGGGICFTIYQSTDTINYQVIAECVPNEPFTISSAGCFRVSAITVEGESELSDPVCTPSECTAPEAITGGSDSPEPNTATLSGTGNPNGFDTVGFFEWGLTTGYGNTTTPQALGSGIGGIGFSSEITDLTPGETYHYRAVAQSECGTSVGADSEFTTECPLPSAETSAASSITNTTATLNGNINPNGIQTEGFFEWGLTTGYGNITSLQDLGDGLVAMGFSDGLTGLTPGTTYHFRAVADSTCGGANGEDQSFVTSGGGEDQVVTMYLGVGPASSDGIDPARIGFDRGLSDPTNALVVYYSMSGVAVNGVDYTIDLPSPITIPAGEASIYFELVATPDINITNIVSKSVTATLVADPAYTIGVPDFIDTEIVNVCTGTAQIVSDLTWNPAWDPGACPMGTQFQLFPNRPFDGEFSIIADTGAFNASATFAGDQFVDSKKWQPLTEICNPNATAKSFIVTIDYNYSRTPTIPPNLGAVMELQVFAPSCYEDDAQAGRVFVGDGSADTGSGTLVVTHTSYTPLVIRLFIGVDTAGETGNFDGTITVTST